MNLSIVYTEKAVFLTKKIYPSWKEIQDDFEGYKASLESWTAEEVIEFLEFEYKNIEPPVRDQVYAFVNGNLEARKVLFRANLNVEQ